MRGTRLFLGGNGSESLWKERYFLRAWICTRCMSILGHHIVGDFEKLCYITPPSHNQVVQITETVIAKWNRLSCQLELVAIESKTLTYCFLGRLLPDRTPQHNVMIQKLRGTRRRVHFQAHDLDQKSPKHKVPQVASRMLLSQHIVPLSS